MMKEQTANLCTSDACEALRARLAKYEDAEGRPVIRIGEIGAEASEFEAAFPGYKALLHDKKSSIATGKYERMPSNMFKVWLHLKAVAADALESQALEIERLTREAKNDAIAYKAAIERQSEIRAELDALKARSGGVVLPEWMESARAFVDRLYMAGWRDHADAQHAAAAGLYDELLARLNSSPVSLAPNHSEQAREVTENFVCESKPLQDLLNATALMIETPCQDSAMYWAAQLEKVESLLKGDDK